jgi:hypothetical protein
LGFTGAQIFARVLVAVAYSVTLTMLFRRFALSTIEGVVVVMAFVVLGQTLFADEWLFDGAEPKVPAYALVFAGLALTIDRKYIGAAFLFVFATYLHVLVGVFWFFAAMALALIEDCSERQRPLFATAVFLLLVAPLLGLIASTRFVFNPMSEQRAFGFSHGPCGIIPRPEAPSEPAPPARPSTGRIERPLVNPDNPRHPTPGVDLLDRQFAAEAQREAAAPGAAFCFGENDGDGASRSWRSRPRSCNSSPPRGKRNDRRNFSGPHQSTAETRGRRG